MFGKEILDILDRVISIGKVKIVMRNLKNGKAAGLEKYVDDNFLHLVTLILNKIFDSGKFPEEWALGVIVILFQKGTKSDLNNYRGVILLSMLGKILIGILNNRLWEVVNKFEILTESQAGFRQGYRTTDHLFTLTTLTDHYTTKNKKSLFLCFIDFRKAFDKVDYELLWRKISNYGAGGKYFNVIKSMYEKVKSCIRSKNGLTNFFNHRRGVRQGCLLSPFCFHYILMIWLNVLKKIEP